MHEQIESFLGNLCERPLTCGRNCVSSCPVCLDIIDKHIMPISRQGVCTFLGDVFINNTPESLPPTVLEDKLKNYADIGTMVHCRPRSSKAHWSKYLPITVLQLAASERILLNFDASTRECSCRLVVVDAMPVYMTYPVCLYMYTINEE